VKILSLLLAAGFALPAMAAATKITDRDLADRCWNYGVQKLMHQARAFQCQVNPTMVTISDIDNRAENHSKYIWFEAPSTCPPGGFDRITVMVQYDGERCL
jgi:hypothetical protein